MEHQRYDGESESILGDNIYGIIGKIFICRKMKEQIECCKVSKETNQVTNIVLLLNEAVATFNN